MMKRKIKIYLQVLDLFAPREKRKLMFISVAQVFLGLFDLVGVILMGLIGVVAVTGVTSQHSGSTTERALQLLQISTLSFQKQVAIIGLLSVVLLVSKTLIALVLTRRSMLFLSNRSAKISVELLDSLLHSSIIDIESKSTQSQLFGITQGVASLGIGVIGSTIALISDISLLLLISIGITLLNPITALNTFALFLALGFFLNRITSKKAENLGKIESELNIESNRLIVESINSYRELFVHNRQNFYLEKVETLRRELGGTIASLAMMPNISKYIVEITLLIAGLLVSAIQFSTQDARHATATLAVFLASGTRIAPALLRIQQGLLVFNTNLGNAAPTLALISELKESSKLKSTLKNSKTEKYRKFISEVSISSLQVKYPASPKFSLQVDSLQIKTGESVAIVGKSGAGKTTLVDAIMGLIPIKNGEVRISGMNPVDAIATYPGKISYVPQQVQIAEGTIAANVALGYDPETWNVGEIRSALKIAQLEGFINDSELGLNTEIHSEGSNLSGGQKQRIGIARALYTHPEILILDESTSSLDAQTENDLNFQLTQLKGKVTLLVIAHRLSTVMSMDKIIYLENGSIRASGTFDEVRSQVPEFDIQANILNL